MTVPVEPGQTAGSGTQQPAQPAPKPTQNPSNPHYRPANNAWIWPTNTTNTVGGWSFGQNIGGGNTHKGVDIETPSGSPIYAVSDGTIGFSDDAGDWNSGYGNLVILGTDVGGFKVYYAHLSESLVKAGDHVTKGQLLGYTGNTGNSTGPHLHLEVRSPQNAVIDPDKFFGQNPNPTTIPVQPYSPPSPGSSPSQGEPGTAAVIGAAGAGVAGASGPSTGNVGSAGVVAAAEEGGMTSEYFWVIVTPLGNIYIPKPRPDWQNLALYLVGGTMVLIGIAGFILPNIPEERSKIEKYLPALIDKIPGAKGVEGD